MLYKYENKWIPVVDQIEKRGSFPFYCSFFSSADNKIHLEFIEQTVLFHSNIGIWIHYGLHALNLYCFVI